MKRSGLARVAAVYGQVERVRLVELQRAAAAVAEMEGMRVAAAAASEALRGVGRAALARGEAAGWRLAESECKGAEVIASRASVLKEAREVLHVDAGEHYRESRLQTERVGRMVKDIELVETLSEERRAQLDADDRYAARLCWSRMKAG